MFLFPYIALILTNYDYINPIYIAMFFSHIRDTIKFSKHLKEEKSCDSDYEFLEMRSRDPR